MIPRYCRPEMASLWTDQHKFKTWLKVELAVCEVRAQRGEIPSEDWDQIRTKAAFEVDRISAIEDEVRHDVIAFLTAVAENVGPASRHIHVGMTSSDVLDTALALNMTEAADLIHEDLEALHAAIGERAREHKYTPCMGRSHGVHAEPTTFGLKLAVWYTETGRNLDRLALARKQIACGQISGAVGTCSHLPPDIEEAAMELLGLAVDPVSTQIVQRDRHAFFLSTLAVIASSLEKMSTELRNLQRTELLEVEEFFGSKQKGSSAMPHKRNPITSEQVTGLARVIRSNSLAGLENVSLWHERDLTHSSVERVIIPDSCILMDYITTKLTGVIQNLLVYPENMQGNIDKSLGLIYSQRVLLALTDAGLTREESYLIVQRNAMRSWKEKVPFPELLDQDPDIQKHLSQDQIQACLDQDAYFTSVDHLFQRSGL